MVLFDEIEKPHNDVFNILLQVLDEGHLTDGLGHNVNFKNTIIILTSNLGYDFFQNKALSKDELSSEVMKTVRATFRPELINRLDEIIVFNSLSRENMRGVVEIQLHDLKKRLEEKKIDIVFGEDLKNWLCEIGYDNVYGARPLKRCIQKELHDLVARKIIALELHEGSKIKADYKNEKVCIT